METFLKFEERTWFVVILRTSTVKNKASQYGGYLIFAVLATTRIYMLTITDI